MSTQQSDGIPYETYLQIGGEYFITTNLDVQDGLFNGFTGCIKHIEYGKTATNPKVPKCVWMDFRNPLVGVERRKNVPNNCTPIEHITRPINKFKQSGFQLFRKQIPIVACNGMTIDKSQGTSLPYVVVNINKKLTTEYLYVACGRATTLSGLYINGVFEPPTKVNDDVTKEMQRLRNLSFPFYLKFLQDFPENVHKIYFHNIQSFLTHFDDIINDKCAMSSNCLAFVEPLLKENDNFEIPNYKIFHRINCLNNRDSQSALILIKSTLYTNSKQFTFTSGNSHCLFITWEIDNIFLIMTYKSPNYSSKLFISKLEHILNNIQN